MSVRSVLRSLLALFLHRGGPEPADHGPEAPADDATAVVSPSQAVTVSIERPPTRRLSDSKSRKPLPWPAREANRLQRPSAEEDAGPQILLPPADGPDVDDVTVVVPVVRKDEPEPDPDVTVVWPAGDAAGRRPS